MANVVVVGVVRVKVEQVSVRTQASAVPHWASVGLVLVIGKGGWHTGYGGVKDEGCEELGEMHCNVQ